MEHPYVIRGIVHVDDPNMLLPLSLSQKRDSDPYVLKIFRALPDLVEMHCHDSPLALQACKETMLALASSF